MRICYQCHCEMHEGFDVKLPTEWTYPLIQPILINKVEKITKK
jgi:hypothetical protein